MSRIGSTTVLALSALTALVISFAVGNTDSGVFASQNQSNPKKQQIGKPAGPISALLPNGDLLITDFEENNFGVMRQWGWLVEGDAFAQSLDQATKIMERRTVTHGGKYLLSSFAGSDAATGRMVSPAFEIELKYIQFQVSGGDHPHRVCVNLVVDGKVMRTVTGRNSDLFETVAFDVSALKGQQVKLEILDAHRGIWGHINVDRMIQTGRTSAKRVIANAPIDFGKVLGAVLTIDQRCRGPLTLDKKRLAVGKQFVEMDSVLQVVCANEAISFETFGALRLIDGQVLFGHLLELKDGKFSIENPMFKRSDAPLEQIASIEFKPGKSSGGTPGTLYRDQGEPIPGKLVWIRQKDVAIDCDLGVVPVPRTSIQRLVLAKLRPQVDSSQDELALIDGNLLRGTLRTEDEGLVLDHSTLGTLNLRWSQVLYIRRAIKGVTWLDGLNGEVLERLGPVLPPPAPSVVAGFAENSDCLRAIRVMPKTVTRYKLPTGPDKRTLRGVLAPVPGCRADINVRVKDGKNVLWEKQIAANSGSIAVEVDLKHASEFTIEVDFVERIAFPCGVDWRDTHVLATNEN